MVGVYDDVVVFMEGKKATNPKFGVEGGRDVPSGDPKNEAEEVHDKEQDGGDDGLEVEIHGGVCFSVEQALRWWSRRGFVVRNKRCGPTQVSY